jgi:uncharacterized protein
MPETINATRTAIAWFEIPVADLERAKRFYEAIFETQLRTEEFGSRPMAVFPYEAPGVGGCLVEDSHPSPHGALIYLNADGRLGRTLERVESAGGRVEMPKTELPADIGFIGLFIDSEGNRVGLHSIS